MTHSANRAPLLDRYTTMGDLTRNVARMVKRYVPWGTGLLALETGFLFYAGSPGALAFGLLSIGVLVALATWSPDARGVPLLPMLMLQTLAVYGLPIASGHKDVSRYPADYVNQSGFEIIAYCLALTLAWKIAMQVFRTSSPQAYSLQGVDREGSRGLARLGFGLAASATLFLVLQSLGLTSFIFELLPAGSFPIIHAGISAASACGFFLVSMIAGGGGIAVGLRVAFWVLMATNCLINASGFMLSGTAVVLASIAIGLFWSSGRIPWAFVLTVAVLVSFFNTGKYAMRERYWESADNENARPSGFAAMPALYTEWTQASLDALAGGDEPVGATGGMANKPEKQQGLLERLNNLQNILFVIEAMEAGHIPALDGRTYAVIPPLLVPRILWPSKPRTHEGQVLLNTHFRRQDLQSTFKTYIAWGLLAEAYGNFGPIRGVIFLGLVMGVFCAWAETFTSRKPLLSAEGFVAFVVFLGLANSFEMVASVMITTIFQSVVPVVIACVPFVRYRAVTRPAAP